MSGMFHIRPICTSPFLLGSVLIFAAGDRAVAAVDFLRDIQPLLAGHCLKCHGPEKQKGGLRLDSRTAALQGGDDGKVILPGKSESSRLIHLVSGGEPDKIMPPKGEKLSDQNIGLLRQWINEGASWPEAASGKPAGSSHWSFQPLTLTASSEPPGQSVDGFIHSRLAKEGLAPAPEADRPTLIRRLTFDLTGLPPSPDEIASFASDPSPHAYEALVDRLLASPHYGERQGRHWLDIARYTESDGFEYDRLRPNAWYYRDYVIKAFNDDLPYDAFMRQQVAGDVLEPVTKDSIAATSLLVCGPWDAAGNSQSNVTQRMITREDEMEDLLSVVGQSFLGLTINCARCHSHKFDPIPHADYYRLKAVFDGVKHGERPLITPAESARLAQRKAALEGEIAAAAAGIQQLESAGARLAARQQGQAAPPPGPVPYAAWDFANPTPSLIPGEPLGGALTGKGGLQLQAPGAFFQSAPLPRDIREKTLEAWVTLSGLEQGGGGIISLEKEDGTVFDAIVFGERQPRRWSAGSEGFARTMDLPAADETAAPDTVVHLAAVYHADSSIALYRNGVLLGQPWKPASPLQTFPAGKSHLLLGKRHTGGGRSWFTGTILRAALHDRALTAEEVAESCQTGGHTVLLEKALACLTGDQLQERSQIIARRNQLQAALAALPQSPPPAIYAGTRVQPPPTRRLIRGEVNSPDETVTPGTLSAISSLNPDFGLSPDAPEAERRTKFAEWLSDPRNPLPARVMVNRLWQFHFGQGIVATASDFGVSGARPTHPELLDWLASEFIRSGWSIKAMHRLILNSATYRQASTFQEKAAAQDADNQLLWRYPPHRLEAEAVRDSMLAASGELNPQSGGPGFQPFTITEFNAAFYHPTDPDGPAFNRRTIYRMNVNSGKDPLLDAFDCPDPSVKTPRRSITTTPLQALELMNHSFVQRQARKLSDRITTRHPHDPAAAIDLAWQLALGRPPAPDEAARAALSAETRGLDSVCWALLNSTEFLYVR